MCQIFCPMKGAGLVDPSKSGRPSVITKNITKLMDKRLEDEKLSATEFRRHRITSIDPEKFSNISVQSTC